VIFEVWAPRAKSVSVELGQRQFTMEPAEAGWWRVDVRAQPGSDYWFRVDGGERRPDPRSGWQPQGVHGPSRVVDHGAFAWQDDGWQAPPLASAILYELHVGTFTPEGTFEAVLSKLDHLKALGVTHLELMPVAEFPGRRGWGYDGTALNAPKHHYGGPLGLKRLVDGCHRHGLGVVLDVVYNHLGPSGNYLAEFGPYFTPRYQTPWGPALNLDGPHSDEVRRFLCDNAIQWLRDYHLDGLRLDAVHAFFDQSAVHFLEQLSVEVGALSRELGRPLILIAESDLNDPRVVREVEHGGYGLDAQWSDDFHHALHALLTGERAGYYNGFGRLRDLAKALTRVFVYDGTYSPHRRRRHGRPVGDLPRTRFVASVQNHDQIGNRARGDRLSELVPEPHLRAAAALLLLSPFVPLLFQGEEWGTRRPFPYFIDHDEPGLADAVRQGRRDEFIALGWKPEDIPDPQSDEAFQMAVLDWAEPERQAHASLLDWHRELIALRHTFGDAAAPAAAVRFDETGRWLVLERGSLSVVCNLSGEPREIPLPAVRPRAVHLSAAEVQVSDGAVTLGPGVVVLGPGDEATGSRAVR
jgi:maltooligosyltrehalose trehalohydrolase